jgi:hypothetical protein
VGFFNRWGIKLSEFCSEFDSLSHLLIYLERPLQAQPIASVWQEEKAMRARSVFKASPSKLPRLLIKVYSRKIGASCKSASLQVKKTRHVTCHLLLATCFLPLAICSLPGVAMAQDSSASKNPWKGRDVFHAKGCVKCHAVYGEGGKIGPDLGQRKFYGGYLQLAGVMWNHFPRMYEAMQKERVPWLELSNEEMSDLIAYLFYIRYLGEPGNEYRGRKLLATKGCFPTRAASNATNSAVWGATSVRILARAKNTCRPFCLPKRCGIMGRR